MSWWDLHKLRTCFPDLNEDEYAEQIKLLMKNAMERVELVKKIDSDMEPIKLLMKTNDVIDEKTIVNCLDENEITVSPWVDVKHGKAYIDRSSFVTKIEFENPNSSKILKIDEKTFDLDPDMGKSVIDAVLLGDICPYTEIEILTTSSRIRFHYYFMSGINLFSPGNMYTKYFRDSNRIFVRNSQYIIAYNCGCAAFI